MFVVLVFFKKVCLKFKEFPDVVHNVEVHPSFVSGIGYIDFEKGCCFFIALNFVLPRICGLPYMSLLEKARTRPAKY